MKSEGVGCMDSVIGLLIVAALGFFIGGFCVEYSVEFWAGYLKGVAVDVPFLPCGIAGIFIGSVAIPIALVTWIFSFVL